MSLPRQNSQLVDADGRPTREFYTWMRGLMAQTAEADASAPAVSELSDVAISSLTDGDALVYDNSIGRWVNGAGGGGGGYDEGTSFPGSPATGDKFYRTDLNWLCFYDGTRWLTCHEYNEPISVQDRLQPAVTNNDNLGYLAIRQDYLPYIQKVYGISVVITTNNGSNYWTALVATVNAAGTLTTLTSFNTSADAAGTRYAKSMTVNQAMTSSMLTFQLSGQRTGTPGAFYPILSVNYRLIVT